MAARVVRSAASTTARSRWVSGETLVGDVVRYPFLASSSMVSTARGWGVWCVQGSVVGSCVM